MQNLMQNCIKSSSELQLGIILFVLYINFFFPSFFYTFYIPFFIYTRNAILLDVVRVTLHRTYIFLGGAMASRVSDVQSPQSTGLSHTTGSNLIDTFYNFLNMNSSYLIIFFFFYWCFLHFLTIIKSRSMKLNMTF